MKRTQTRLPSRILAFLLALLMFGSCFPAVFATDNGDEPTVTPSTAAQPPTPASESSESGSSTNPNGQPILEEPTTPTVTVVRSADGWVRNADLTIAVSGIDGIAAATVSLNGSEAMDVAPNDEGTYVFPAAENGVYLFVVTDTAGNVYEVQHDETQIDMVCPELSDISRTEEGTVTQATYVFSAADADSGITSVTVDIDGTKTDLALAEDGIYQFTVSANAQITVEVLDTAGSAASKMVEETSIEAPAEPTATETTAEAPFPDEEETNPTVQISRLSDGWVSAADYLLSVQDSEQIRSVSVKFGEQEPEVLTPEEGSSYIFTARKNGTYVFIVTDTADNCKEVTVEETMVDCTAPSITDFLRESFAVEENVYLVATYSFSVSDEGSGLAAVRAIVGDAATELEFNSETSRYEYYAESNGTISFEVTDVAGNSTVKTVEESGITEVPNEPASFASPGALSSTYAYSHLVNSLAYMGMDVTYLRNNNLFFNVFNLAGASSYYNVSAQLPSWRWSLYDGTTGTYPSTIKPSIEYNSRAYDHATAPQAMGTETTAAGLPDVTTIRARGMVCLGYPNYYYFNYLPNVVGSETVAGGKIDYKAATNSLRSYFDTYTYTTTGLVMANCPGTIELWREALDEAAADYSNPYLKVTKWTSIGNPSLNKEGVYDQLTPGDIVIHSGNAGYGYTDNSHIGMYAGSRQVVKNWYLGAANTQVVEEHFFIDMTPDGIGLYSLSYLAGSNKTGGPNTWYHIEFKPQSTGGGVDTPQNDGIIEVYKKDPNGANLAGAVFSVVNSSAGITEVLGPTDANGYAKIDGLPYGTYTVKETVFPTGYTASGQTEWTVTIGANTQTVTINAVNKKSGGNIQIVKTTSTGANLEGWNFNVYTDAALTNLYGSYTTDAEGFINITDVPEGTYYIQEDTTGVDNYWECDTALKSVDVTSGNTASVSFNNVHKGRISVQKSTNTGVNLNGWKFDIKDSAGNVVETLETNEYGQTTSSLLPLGTYTVVERGTQDGYWVTVSTPVTAVVEAGKTTTTYFHNDHMGQIIIKKVTNTGSELGNWTFDIKDAEGNIVQTLVTDGNGTSTSALLAPGNYTVVERSTNNTFWASVDPNQTATVVAGQNTFLTFTNNKRGQIQITKVTNTGNNKDNWTFEVKDSAGTLVDTLVTNENGYDLSIMLMPGTYTVTEVARDDHYWSCDVTDHIVEVKAGEVAGATVTNVHRGRAQVIKKTNTEANLDGWIFGIYTDLACTNKVAELTSGSDGKSNMVYLEPGTYYWTEIGQVNDLFDSEYWPSNAEVREIKIVEGQDTVVEHTNVHYGKINIVKTMATDGPLDGWVFHIYDSTGTEIEGSPFTTDADGHITTGVLLPGTYTVKEDLPESNLYYCKSENPQTVTVTAGQTASVTFTNALRPGKIQITKVNYENEKLADAKFALEWSEDNGNTWHLVHYSDKEDVVKGGCSSPNLIDGTLITDASGVITFENLYPTLLYRVTEVEAPSGYVLLKEAAFMDVLPIENLTAELTVYNGSAFTFPATGVEDKAFDAVSIGTAMVIAGLILAMGIIAHNVPNGIATVENKPYKEERKK